MSKNKFTPKTSVSKEELKQLVKQEVKTISFSGPVPPPDMLEKYEKIVPGSGKIIFEQFVKQTNHRHQMETKVTESNIKNETRGQWMGFIIFMIGVGGGIALLWKGVNIAGYISLFGSLAAIIGMFVTRKSKVKKELKEKKE